MTLVAPLIVEQAAINEARAWLRLDDVAEDGLIEGLVHAAILLGEAYIGQLMVVREVTERVPAASSWQRLRHRPVRAIQGVSAVSDAFEVSLLGSGDYAVDIDPAGDGWVRQAGDVGARWLEVRYRAGLGLGWGDVPASLRQGVIRLAAHGYTHRDDGNDEGPPAAVTAMWRPWRRMML
ncbi:head-tail connector protein [Aquisediminimonas sediminicola]|uniref:head-tail connector protein n=1 Tax=Alteraquisediminimonas sediminicola TaxID=2676787 RepID=UPI001C8F07D6|nr:hypothetical protein [Aquisediminimonas sediminicola]